MLWTDASQNTITNVSGCALPKFQISVELGNFASRPYLEPALDNFHCRMWRPENRWCGSNPN